MKNRTCVATWVISRLMMAAGVVALTACSQTNRFEYTGPVATPTVDYVESLDVYSAPHQDSFLSSLYLLLQHRLLPWNLRLMLPIPL